MRVKTRCGEQMVPTPPELRCIHLHIWKNSVSSHPTKKQAAEREDTCIVYDADRRCWKCGRARAQPDVMIHTHIHTCLRIYT